MTRTLEEFLEVFPEAEIIEVIPGDNVICDLCDKDFTDLPDQGGFLFLSKGVCPDCAPRFEAKVKEFQEEEFIRARCPPGKSFADWIREDCR